MIIDNKLDQKIKDKLNKLGEDEDEELAKYLANMSALPYVNLKLTVPEMESLLKINLEEAKKSSLVPFKLVNKTLHIATTDPKSVMFLAAIKKIGGDLNNKPIIYIASQSSLNHVYARYADLSDSVIEKKGVVNLNGEDLKKYLSKVSTLSDFQKQIEYIAVNEKKERVSKIIEMTMAGAIHFSASDIHIEPESELIRYRYRIDGNLIDVYHTDKKTYDLVNSRLKLLSGMKLSNTQNAQDGRFSMQSEDGDIEMRVSLVPTANGESFVMRLLDPKNANVPFESLGMSKKLMEELDKAIHKPFGMILTTGPTGSGKSTTLYACLKRVYNPEVKIITIEDPIEYHLDGIVQTQVEVKKDYTFLNGLRAALRQDPDVIMVGEIRDDDTAKVASQAALTGHIVLSTLHTNTAAGAIPRFINLGVDARTLGSSLSLVIAQRLCRKLCLICRTEEIINENTDKRIFRIFTNTLGKMLSEGKETDYTPQSEYKIYKANSDGCEKCTHGYKGRIGIYEAIVMNKKVEEVSIKSGSERDVAEASNDQQIPNMQEDGIIKILSGITSVEELSKVVDIN